ncbi:hypothetical protein F5Y17DRAFT_477632 [Xylariaceae sp. FL0594]|nr:hypothetical protein F5Y17DRAFT_477632 [Xylariaceae sp. FL0594]
MTSLVTDFLVSPVLRQARRFSLSRASQASNPTEPDPSLRVANQRRHSQQDDVISETEEDSYLQETGGESASSQLSSRSSLQPNPPGEEYTQPGTASASASRADGPPETDLEWDTTTPADPSALPEDDGMGFMRRRIFAIQAQEIDNAQKAQLMHQLFTKGYTNSPSFIPAGPALIPSSPKSCDKQTTPALGPLESFKFWQSVLSEEEDVREPRLTDKDLEPTFVPTKQQTEGPSGDAEDGEPAEEHILGCEHYRRNVKLQCSTCNRWYTCRFCHDSAEDHTLIRQATKNMLCMFCGTAQKASQLCVSCEAPAARYYCDICKLWNDDPDKPCYHCNDCGICRIGRGIGKDFFHCQKCSVCISIATRLDHRCIERATDCDCPICGEYLFTSPSPVCFMKCGHSIHRKCFEEHMKTSYKCPICNKSLANMESQFRNLELSIQAQPMPLEFRNTRAIVLCHDCSAKSSTQYHWLGSKCGVCQSYNTAQLQIIGLAADVTESDLATRSEQASGPPAHPESSVADPSMREMRRRHSSTVTGPTNAGVSWPPLHTERLGRSVSPVLTPGHSLHASAVGGYFDLEEDENDTDIIGFWSRVPRSITSNDADGDESSAESSDDLSSDEEHEDDEGGESEDDDFELLGHR